MSPLRLNILFENCMNGTATPDERREFWQLMQDQEAEARGIIKSSFEIRNSLTVPDEENFNRIFSSIINVNRIEDTINSANTVQLVSPTVKPAVHRVHFLRRGFFKYAAAILLIVGAAVGYYIFSHTSQPDKEVAIDQPSPKSNDVLPGYNRAVLTLSNGQKVELDSAASETIKDGTLAIKNTDGKLSYKNAEVDAVNTMSTPKGGQYKLTLADGTNVWLNAASSITFPTAFKGKSREVSITGEAYFEVAKNKEKPFIVSTPKEKITVLGTSFNVNVYTDEPASKTSLVEGSIKINELVLRPGQAYDNGVVVATNIEQDMAWKNGVFNFTGTNLVRVMRQIERWYDVQVVFEGKIPAISVEGELPKDFTLQQVLAAFSDYRLRYQLEGRQLIISP